jgi:hypothetical protein
MVAIIFIDILILNDEGNDGIWQFLSLVTTIHYSREVLGISYSFFSEKMLRDSLSLFS